MDKKKTIEVELMIPTELKEITLQQYQMFVEKSKGMEPLETAQIMVQYLIGIDLEELAKINYMDLVDIFSRFNSLFDKEDFEYIPKFKIGDIEFGAIPCLEDISIGEYIDMEEYIKDISTYHKFMAVFYRPIVKKRGFINNIFINKDRYEIMDYTGTENYEDLMKFAPMDAVLGATFFLFNLYKELVEDMMDCSEAQVLQKLNTTQKPSLVPSGVGITASTH
jgi:hypothetical protein